MLIADYGLTWPIGASIEDTISATLIIFEGVPVRNPSIKIINSHLGGALPMPLQQLDNQYLWSAPGLTKLQHACQAHVVRYGRTLSRPDAAPTLLPATPSHMS